MGLKATVRRTHPRRGSKREEGEGGVGTVVIKESGEGVCRFDALNRWNCIPREPILLRMAQEVIGFMKDLLTGLLAV